MVATRQQRQSSGLHGLSQAEVVERQARAGPNTISRQTSRSYGRIARQNLLTFLNLLIFGISLVLAILGLFIDAILAGILGLSNALIAIVQEVRAKRALDRIALLTRPDATVIRDGQEQTIQIEDVVCDDVLLAQAGDQIVADGSVIDVVGAAMDESLLSGESELVPKSAGDPLYAGSFCMSGRVFYRAERIGRDSVAERIDSEARVFNIQKTPLQREIIVLMRGLLVLILLLTLLVLGRVDGVAGSFPFDQPMMEDASRATAVLVGLIPQGLVLMITVTYAMTIIRLARKNALVQHMNAAESLSHIDVLCLDKTGTITTNQLSLHAIVPLGIDRFELQQTLGDFVASSASTNRTASAIAASCAGSLRRLCHEVPFDSDRKWSALSFDDDGKRIAYVLGAPEVLLPSLRADTHVDEGTVNEWTGHGLRVLLFAASEDSNAIADSLAPRLPVDLVPLGLIALRDELRADVQGTIDHFVQAGISLKLISGDHVNTVTTLARRAGIQVNDVDQIVSGQQLEGLSDDEYGQIAQRGVAFGRVTPQQKERLVSALRNTGHYVAMIGDGVNDVPALKHAQVAVAMRSGSAVTRSIADIVLLDDAFTALPDAVLEGQRVRNGLKTTIELFLTRTIYTMLIIWAAAIGGGEFPVVFRHSVLIGMLSVGMPAFALAMWATPGNVERRVLPAVMDFVVPAAVTIALAGFAIYQVSLRLFDIAVAQSALTALTITCSLLLIPFLHPPTGFWEGVAPLSRDWRPALFAVLMFVLYLGVLFVPPLQRFYEIEPLPLVAYPLIVAFVCVWLLSVRWIWRHSVMTQLHARIAKAWQRISFQDRLRSRLVSRQRQADVPPRH